MSILVLFFCRPDDLTMRGIGVVGFCANPTDDSQDYSFISLEGAPMLAWVMDISYFVRVPTDEVVSCVVSFVLQSVG